MNIEEKEISHGDFHANIISFFFLVLLLLLLPLLLLLRIWYFAFHMWVRIQWKRISLIKKYLKFFSCNFIQIHMRGTRFYFSSHTILCILSVLFTLLFLLFWSFIDLYREQKHIVFFFLFPFIRIFVS